ncbi:MAG: AAA family ATPase [Candidatus Lokiarchaeota archaeon]|nr:AAA family ATPase [Candidatus Lokiarchaeota archaeon]
MLKEKIQDILQENIIMYRYLDDKWNQFTINETYLPYDKKDSFLKDCEKYQKFPWYSRFVFNLSSDIKNLKQKFKDLKRKIRTYNSSFIENRLKKYQSFFDGEQFGIKYPLDQSQRHAIVKDDKHNLIIAGAGSGKTSVITSRIAYLIKRKDNVEKERILALAFTRVAAEEMQKRIKKFYDLEVEISTFHALGRNIIKEETLSPPQLLFDGSPSKISQLMAELFNQSFEDEHIQSLIIQYVAYYIDEDLQEESFEDKAEYYEYMRNKKYTTFNNLIVKSLSEKNIANFLFRNKIEFEYEPLVEWVDKDDEINLETKDVEDTEIPEEKKYHPDFYLPEYDVYIEHWGLNKSLEVPEWFTSTSEEYRELRKWKLAQFEKHDKCLVETWDYERREGTLISNLEQNLKNLNKEIVFRPLSYHELVEMVYEFKENVYELTKLISSFIKIAKSNFFRIEDIQSRVKSRKFSKKQRLFGKIALDVYKRYQKYLYDEQKIDFNDMINYAIEFVRNNQEKYSDRYSHVLVDEFQDISNQRMELINGFVNDHSNTKLFCVGDDWQSIYQFTGSDVSFFIDFEQYFPHPETTHLTWNYRSIPNIVEMANSLISHNKYQVKKVIKSIRQDELKPLLFRISNSASFYSKTPLDWAFKLIEKLLDERVAPEDIMVLSRFNKRLNDLEIQCGAAGMPIKEKGAPRSSGIRFYSAHRSKGSESEHVILLDIVSGLYGFPCEIQDSSVLDLARRNKTKSHIEEERRLFYVALTRSKKFLYVFTVEDNESLFIEEIEPFMTSIFVGSNFEWNEILSVYIPAYLNDYKDLEDRPLLCPQCCRILTERSGKYGRFFGCTGYPQCTYIYDLVDENDIRCSDCGKKLILKKGRYGWFLGCIGYPNCNFAYSIKGKSKRNIYCPKCGKILVIKGDNYAKRLICSKQPKCDFIYELY